MRLDASGAKQISALTIAGSDSGGNAGIQADIRAFHVFGLHACTVITALTAQNPYGVRAVEVPEAGFIGDQMDAVLEEYGISALKTGMLATAAVIEVVSARLAKRTDIQKVIDPVMVATSGAKLLRDDAVEAMKQKMLPLATLITPNIPEAEVILGCTLASREDMTEAAIEMHRRFGCSVLVKGGHSTINVAADVLYEGDDPVWYSTPWVLDPVSTHGTGCSLSAAIAASLACGRGVRAAVAEGKAYVYESIRCGLHVGARASVLGTPEGIGRALEQVSVSAFHSCIVPIAVL
jgi:hydroxymethylpyrimidine/phosphomethylpyrimidine kinase